MRERPEPTRPVDAYKAIIDQLVAEDSHGVHEKLIVEQGIWSKAHDADAPNAFVQSLSLEQRSLLARMIHDERTGAIHDVLATLTWWIVTRDVGLTFRGEPMPVELCGNGLHWDYIVRLDDGDWPPDG